MHDRPKNIPQAVREAFETSRMRTAWSMLDSQDASIQMAALNGMIRILKASRLTMDDIATAIGSIPDVAGDDAHTFPSEGARPSPRRTTPPAGSAFAEAAYARTARHGFRESPSTGGSFAETDFAGDGRPPESARGAATRKVVQDVYVPDAVVGRIRQCSDLPSQNDTGPFTFLVEADDAIYGPIAAYSGPQMAHLVEAQRSNWIMRVTIQPTVSERILPKVRRMETV